MTYYSEEEQDEEEEQEEDEGYAPGLSNIPFGTLGIGGNALDLASPADLASVESLAKTVFGPDYAQIWMQSPNLNLGGLTPHFVVLEGESDGVVAILEAARFGAFS